MGLSKKPRLPEYWSKNTLYDNSVEKLISRNRFKMLLRMRHFSNNEECPPGDRLFKIQPLLDRLLERFQLAVVPGKEICIDETMLPFCGRLSFLQYIKNKSHKFGIKLFRALVGKPEGRRPLGRPRRRWEDNIKMDLREGWGGLDWINLAQDRDKWRALVNAVMNLQVP
jgi:hypothetical protein